MHVHPFRVSRVMIPRSKSLAFSRHVYGSLSFLPNWVLSFFSPISLCTLNSLSHPFPMSPSQNTCKKATIHNRGEGFTLWLQRWPFTQLRRVGVPRGAQLQHGEAHRVLHWHATGSARRFRGCAHPPRRSSSSSKWHPHDVPIASWHDSIKHC